MIKQFGMEGTFLWMGSVVDLSDPLQLGRVKVKVFGEHENVDTEDLPWTTPLLPITSASLKGAGSSPTGLLVGSYVLGVYLDGKEKQKPMVLGSFPKILNGDKSLHDVTPLARGISANSAKIGNEPNSAYAAQYPYNKVYQTQSGHYVEFDDTPGQERIKITHKAGTYTEINKDGRKVDKVTSDAYEVIVGNKYVYIKGNVTIQVEGNADVNVSGDVNLKSSNLKHNGVNIGSDHTHSGVQTGSGNTGKPN